MIRRLVAFGAALIVALFASPALAAPSGYHEAARDDGVVLWRQDVSGGEPDFVLEIDLDHARVQSVVDPTGGAIRRYTVPNWHGRIANGDTFAIVNAAFFNPGIDPTEPAFGLKTPVYNHPGYGTNNEYVGQQRSIHLDDRRVTLVDAQSSMLSGAPEDQVVALSSFADKSAGSWVARTFVGVKDPADGKYRTLLIFASKLSTQAYARGELGRFGAVDTLMLDGGGSTQLRVQGNDLITSSRGVPHVLHVLAGRSPPPPAWAGTETARSFPRPGDGAVELTDLEEAELWVELRNTGTGTWTPALTRLAPIPRDQVSPLAATGWLSPSRIGALNADVPPNGVGRFTFRVRAPGVGEWTQGLGLVQEGVTWFQDGPLGGGPADGEISVRVRGTAEDTGPVDSDPVDSGDSGSDSEHSDPEDSDPEDSDPADSDPVDSDPVDSEPEDTASPDSGPTGGRVSPEGCGCRGGTLAFALVLIPPWLRRRRAGLERR